MLLLFHWIGLSSRLPLMGDFFTKWRKIVVGNIISLTLESQGVLKFPEIFKNCYSRRFSLTLWKNATTKPNRKLTTELISNLYKKDSPRLSCYLQLLKYDWKWSKKNWEELYKNYKNFKTWWERDLIFWSYLNWPMPAAFKISSLFLLSFQQCKV